MSGMSGIRFPCEVHRSDTAGQARHSRAMQYTAGYSKTQQDRQDIASHSRTGRKLQYTAGKAGQSRTQQDRQAIVGHSRTGRT